MSDLSSLIARLEAADGPSREIDRRIQCEIGGWHRVIPSQTRSKHGAFIAPEDWNGEHSDGSPILDSMHGTTMHREVPPVTSSIDAAVSLAERVLPGWGWGVESKTHHIMACLNPEFGEPVGKHPHWAAISNVSTRTFEDAATPAMALVLATLRALQQKGSSNA